MMMNRRTALGAMIKAMGLAGASSVFGASAFASQSAALSPRQPVLSAEEIKLLNEIGETILPATPGSEGARVADVGGFMQEIVSDYYSLEEQQIFLVGLGEFAALTQGTYQRSFLALDKPRREALLLGLEQNPEAVYYQMIKQLTLWGYFSSEVGVKQALRYAPIPGRYDGEVKIEPGTKAWANIGA